MPDPTTENLTKQTEKWKRLYELLFTASRAYDNAMPGISHHADYLVTAGRFYMANTIMREMDRMQAEEDTT